MIKGVHNYSFRNRDLLDYKPLFPTQNNSSDAACEIDNSWEFVINKTDSRLVKYFSCDLVRFLSESFDVCLRVRKSECIAQEIIQPEHKIILVCEADGVGYNYGSEKEGAFYADIRENSVVITGKSEWGTAKGVYYIEDLMRLLGKPCLKEENCEHEPLFAPRMTHSGIELDTYSDNYLEACAHAGMDAIIVFSGHDNTNLHGFDDPDGMDVLFDTIGAEEKTTDSLLDFMTRIAEEEIQNTRMAVKCWEEDSIIGFEASEEYVFDNEFAEWKINETTLSLRRIKEYLR